ncbi:efflux RND transporter periplasmic adaptor subunit [Luteimonas sp. SJ-92]|uniref:Efflux RND transporter periplasmic adaptor subunit n=1 Tax=Luteimonas salinisoli TaxID=2752307 RepID=A0A853JDX4_9GAMM|nr:efflux RND transporter periplasmic adaptor subunit [Luteimonas salinisoli]NZA26954.1 efflux RND transporter periplasmic adaptor subunit [Luteimonas salinisoli]
MYGKTAAALVISALLAGCGSEPVPEATPRPVLVERAGGRAAAAAMALPGEIRAREESTLSFRVGGKLVRRHVDPGARVRRGDLLAELDPGDQRLQARSAGAQAAAAEAELERARADHERYRRLAAEQLVSRSTLDAQTTALRAAEGQARAARAQLDVARNQAGYTELRAPDDGVITERQAEAGQVLAAGQAVYALAVDGGREVRIALPESRIDGFRIGQEVAVELWSAPGRRWPGRIREIAPAADPQARTYAARVALDDEAAGAVALGQSARVYLDGGADASATSVPLSAVQRGEDGGAVVWVVDPKEGVTRRVAVELGAFGPERVPVLSGLRPGALVVAAGGHLLREGQAVVPVDRDNRPLASAGDAPADEPPAGETR